MHIIQMGNPVVRYLMCCRMIITGTRMRRLRLTGRRGREMTRIGRCRNGGGRVGGEGWIDGKCIREDDNGGLVCVLWIGDCARRLMGNYVGVILCFNVSCLA